MIEMENTSETDEDEEIDPFAELDVATTAPARKGEAMLDALVEDDELLSDGNIIGNPNSPTSAVAFEDTNISLNLDTKSKNEFSPSERTYMLLLETVWVDDILDPSEVELLARKRSDLGISFERHLEMVRKIIEA